VSDLLPLDGPALVVFVGAALLMNASPGPSNLYVLSRTIAGGRAAGLASVAGLALGAFGHTLLVAFGLAAVLAAVPAIYVAIKIAGALYLLWLGIRTLMDKGGDAAEALAPKPRGLARVMGQAVLVELTNPKTALFFLAFLPQFVPADHARPGAFIALGVIVILTAVPLDLAVALAAGAMKRRFLSNPAFARVQAWVSGLVLVGLGLFVLAGMRDVPKPR
jgi:threonine/homoserine/homoserine lactone efflux protein